MPGLRAPSDYSQEPPRHPCLKINAKQPFNAEPPRSALISSYVTPVDLFYKRNHGPIPLVDDVEKYSVSIQGLMENPRELFMKDVWMLPKYNVTATLQCAGNRRTAMSKVKTVKGVGWDVSAIGNAVWGGAKLADVLELIGISKGTSTTKSGGKHIEFVSIDKCKEENGGPYKASIPLSQATNPEADVLLAYEMNGEVENVNTSDVFFSNTSSTLLVMSSESKKFTFGKVIESREQKCFKFITVILNLLHLLNNTDISMLLVISKPLNRDHGYPLRVIVPGVIGARSVKWLDAINIIAEECQGFFMQKDYKMFPPSVNWDNINWPTRRPLMDFPVQCVICSLEDVSAVKPGKLKVSGYAVAGGGRGIERVDVSVDGGKSWIETPRFQRPGVSYVADDTRSDKWAWVFFEVTVDVSQSTEIVAKAVCGFSSQRPTCNCARDLESERGTEHFMAQGSSPGWTFEHVNHTKWILVAAQMCPSP
ncbi:hypothetical protein Tsubulata_000661 [Turnera subulata]|uniref:Sulfite oxidase n=1 Tax=Turnera subulata TaxID=218843 RepID=A0A9Q0FGP2_9ROSI|nr:hypothetical protein Tsubulata_000661 [Turnera subulata]